MLEDVSAGSTERRVCRICDKPATGHHYGVLACGGCKVFYRRSMMQDRNYVCGAVKGKSSTQVTCGIECRACRFNKCLAVGMKMQKTVGKVTHCKTHTENSLVLAKRKEFTSENYSGIIRGTGSNFIHDIETSVEALKALPDTLPQMPNLPEIVPLSHNNDPSDLYGADRILTDLYWVLGDSNSSPPLTPGKDVMQVELGSFRLPALSWPTEFNPYSDSRMTNHFNTRRWIAATLAAVESAVDLIYGPQIVEWTKFMENALIYGEIPSQPETSNTNMIVAINQHYGEHALLHLRFSQLLPGMPELDPAMRTCICVGWKWIVYAIIHHGPFILDDETYITIGPRRFHYCKYWQNRISAAQFMEFNYRFAALLREIDLNQIERYVLLAIVMLEPGRNHVSSHSHELKLLHRHYTDVLFDLLKLRCHSPADLTDICQKMENFFNMFKLVYDIHMYYFREAGHDPPTDTVEVKAKVKMLQLQLNYTWQ